MIRMRPFLIGLILLGVLITVVPLPATAAFSLVPCGRSDQQTPPNNPDAQCTLRHLFVTITRTINYLVSMAALVAIFYIVNAGFGMIFAMGNPEQIQKHKEAVRDAVVGLGIVAISFVLINLLINLIFANSSSQRNWWNIDCLFSFNQTGCPLGVAGPGTGGGNQGGQFGTCQGTSCSDSAINICGPQANNCSVSSVNNWNAQIVAGVGTGAQICSGVDAVKMLKAIMARESGGVANAVSSSNPPSLGLFQLKVTTAQAHQAGCTTANIDQAWLLNGANATAQACIAASYLRELASSSICGCDVRQIAAGYNGGGAGTGACEVSTNCGPSAGANQCSICGTAQNHVTKRWECPWDDNAHTMCNADRAGNFSETRGYAPKVEYCYSNF